MLAVAIEFLVNGILRTADTSITGYIVGMTGLSALNIFLPWMLVTYFLGAFFGSGAAIIYSRYMGEFKKERAEEVFTLGTVICAVCRILVFLVTRPSGRMHNRYTYIQFVLHSHGRIGLSGFILSVRGKGGIKPLLLLPEILYM